MTKSTPSLKEIESCAAIVCNHVATRKHPIRYARWDETDDPDDSGWQFVCWAVKREDPKGAQVWALDEVLELEPTLRKPLMDRTVRAWCRKDAESPWEPENSAADE